MNKFYFYPKNEYEFKQKALDAGRIFTEIRKNDKTLDVFERKIMVLWKGSRKTQVSTHSRVRNATTKEPLYSNAKIYSWVPKTTETLSAYSIPQENLFAEE